jgi:hypothetical protein
MPALEKYLEHAPELAQVVVNTWAEIVQAGNTDFTDEFKDVFDKACRFRNAKSTADNRREFKILTEQEATEESATLRAFAKAYKAFYEKHEAAA